MTVAANPFIPHLPTDRQAEFVALECREALYGGAAGGGKSEALLMAALQYAEQPGYAALILRRSYRDLALPGALLDRARSWLTGRAKWSALDNRWTFPSGAVLQFGYLENVNDHLRYQSSEFQFIGFDEATQFPEHQYRYLFSRLRRKEAETVPLRMRAASNPGGKGHEWVKARFIDAKSRGRRVFVPAKLDDNPFLDRAEYVGSLTELDPLTRAQLLKGDWDAIAGGRLNPAWLRYYRRHGTGFYLGARHVVAAEVLQRFLTVDPAASVKETASDDPDYTVISAWNVLRSGELLWVGCLRLRVEVPDIVPRVAEQYARHGCTMAYIEGGGTQKAVAQLAARWTQPRMSVMPLNPTGLGDKLVRATPAINMAEAGRLWLPESDPLFPREDVEAEITRFTGDPKQDGHDDIVDTLAWAGRVADNQLGATQFAPYAVGG